MDAVSYTEGFKKQMVKRMLGPPAVSASALSKQVFEAGRSSAAQAVEVATPCR